MNENSSLIVPVFFLVLSLVAIGSMDPENINPFMTFYVGAGIASMFCVTFVLVEYGETSGITIFTSVATGAIVILLFVALDVTMRFIFTPIA